MANRGQRSTKRASLGLLLLCATAVAAAAEAPAKLPGQEGRDYQPPAFDEAVLTRAQHLPGRDWERLDIWVPKDAPEARMPCLVNLYGGGYSGKVTMLGAVRPLLKQGWVVAQPDCVLGADGAGRPMSFWDVAAAIRYLRAHAARFRIDPERIGVIGWSAGGWRAQYLFYATTADALFPVDSSEDDAQGRRLRERHPVPVLDPHPSVDPEQSHYVQAVVTDWGAGKLWVRASPRSGPARLQEWIKPAVPPLLTVYGAKDEMGSTAGVPPAGAIVNPVTGLKAIGVPARAAYDYPGNTHVARFSAEVTAEDGSKTTWGEMVFKFLDENVKHPTIATAPEIRPAGGPTAGPTEVRMVTVHPTGRIHYTLDGTAPATASPVYEGPIIVQPGQTLKAVVVRGGLKPSRIAEATFVKAPPAPRIAPLKPSYEAQVGKPLELQPAAEHADGVTWHLGGIRQGLACDPATGKVSGALELPIAHPIVLWCYRTAGEGGEQQVLIDMRRTVIVPKE